MKSVTIDRTKRLHEEPNTGHNRWHPDVLPIVEAAPGEEVVLETRDAADGQIKPDTTESDFDSFDAKVGHPLTGPVYVQGAKPGDLLEIEYVNIETPAKRVDSRPARVRLPARHLHGAVPGALEHRRRLGDIAADSRGSHLEWVVYGHGRVGTVSRTIARMDSTRGRSGQPRRHGSAA